LVDKKTTGRGGKSPEATEAHRVPTVLTSERMSSPEGRGERERERELQLGDHCADSDSGLVYVW